MFFSVHARGRNHWSANDNRFSRSLYQGVGALLAGLLLFVSPVQAVQKPIVYLTFDDGPSHDTGTEDILDTLAYYGIRATFFVLGHRVRAEPETLRRIVAAGHAVGNHTYTHRSLLSLSSEEVVQELTATAEIVRHVAGIDMRCYRPPFGAMNSSVTKIALGQGLSELLWHIDTQDWKTGQDRRSIRDSLRKSRDRAVVLMHDGPSGRESTVKALSSWLAEAVDQYDFRVHEKCENMRSGLMHASMRRPSGIAMPPRRAVNRDASEARIDKATVVFEVTTVATNDSSLQPSVAPLVVDLAEDEGAVGPHTPMIAPHKHEAHTPAVDATVKLAAHSPEGSATSMAMLDVIERQASAGTSTSTNLVVTPAVPLAAALTEESIIVESGAEPSDGLDIGSNVKSSPTELPSVDSKLEVEEMVRMSPELDQLVTKIRDYRNIELY